MSFKYSIKSRRTQYSNQQVLDGLKRFAETRNGRAFFMHEFRNWPDRPFSPHLAIQRFGTWRKALAAAGVRGGRCYRCTNEDLIAELERVWQIMGRPPGAKRLRELGDFSPATYRVRWGTLRHACELVERYHNGEITRAELLRTRTAPNRPSLSIKTRWEIMRRDGFACVACGASRQTDKSVKLHIDHIKPVIRGGGNEPENLRTLCRECNQGKRDRED